MTTQTARRIALLTALADSSTFPAEAATYRAKVARLKGQSRFVPATYATIGRETRETFSYPL